MNQRLSFFIVVLGGGVAALAGLAHDDTAAHVLSLVATGTISTGVLSALWVRMRRSDDRETSGSSDLELRLVRLEDELAELNAVNRRLADKVEFDSQLLMGVTRPNRGRE